jgi:acyl-CoA thioester hydrolase
MKKYPKVLEGKMKVRFHDCDPFNHLNNSKYIDYMITSRGDQLLEHYHLDIYKLAMEKAIGWVVAQTQISYFVPAFLMEEVTIKTQLNAFTEKSLLFEASMWNNEATELKAFMWTKLVHFDLQQKKSMAHSADLMQLFGQVVYPLPLEADFDARIKTIRK